MLKKTGAPALAGAVIGRDGLIHVEAEGLRRDNGPDKVTVDDQWHLGSNTKAMTAVLYGRLVEAGIAHWDAPLPTLFPDLKLDAGWSRATIDQVLGHRAGLKDDRLLTPAWLNGSRADTRPLEVQRAELVAKALASPPDGKPGDFAYANANYILAGAAIERLTGGGWEAAMRREVFAPLKMASASFGPPQGANPWGHRGLPLIGGLVRPTPVDPASPGADNPQALGPAGTVHASLADYGRFLRLFLTEGDGFLKPETIARLVRPVGEGVGGQLYGLGWGLVPARPWTHGTALAHEGSNTLWHVMAVVAPARGAAIVAVCNLGPQVSRKATLSMAQRLQKRFVA
jgi:CubicO group peptidase (beta-lactamase class C family)